ARSAAAQGLSVPGNPKSRCHSYGRPGCTFGDMQSQGVRKPAAGAAARIARSRKRARSRRRVVEHTVVTVLLALQHPLQDIAVHVAEAEVVAAKDPTGAVCLLSP